MENVQDYTNGDRYHQQQGQQQCYRQSDDAMSTQGSNERRERFQCPASHRPPFNRRPVTRVSIVISSFRHHGPYQEHSMFKNSNILSAALCLVKELDYPSLEVLDMAVRCRMDELDEWHKRNKGTVENTFEEDAWISIINHYSLIVS